MVEGVVEVGVEYLYDVVYEVYGVVLYYDLLWF